MSTGRQTMKKGEHSSHSINVDEADEKITAMLKNAANPALTERAKSILRKILSKNARVYETDKASAGLHAVSVYLACEEFAPTIGRKLSQKECQQQSNLGPKLFRRTLDLCRHAKDLDESKINFSSLVRHFGGNDAQEYMDIIYKHFRKSCFDAGIVNDVTWDGNHILVVCAIYCWTCDRVFPYPSYKGPEVAFHCGLGWENVQKSMYYNLNPHCTEKMREILEADKTKRMTLSIHPYTPTVLPTITVPRPTLPPSSVSSPKPITHPHLTTPARTISTSSASHSSSSSIPTPTPIPQAPYSSAVTHASVTVPGYGIMDAGPVPSPAPLPPKREPVSTPMEIDLTLSDTDSNATGVSGRARRKNAGKRRIDGEEVTQHPPKKLNAKRKARNEELDSDEAWMSRPNDELFFRTAGESKAETELRVYYAWKRMMIEGLAGKGVAYGENDIRDFVIT